MLALAAGGREGDKAGHDAGEPGQPQAQRDPLRWAGAR